MESEYRQRREQVMAKISGGTAIFRSAPTAVMHNDVEYVYRQDSDFYYLTGFNEPEAVAVLAPHHGEHRFILFVQPKDREKEVWSGYRCGVEGAKEIYGADIAYPITELDDKLPQYLQKAERIYYHLGRDSHFNDRMIRHYQNLLATRPRRGTGPIAIEDTGPIIHGLRLHKSNFEVDLMRQAADIAVSAHNHAMSIARPGSYEYEIQAEIEHIFRLQGGMGPAYPSIVAAGKNACVLHYIENNYQMQEQELLLIDAGCAYKYYNSDITRTFPINGKFTPEQKALYEIVLEAQKQAIQEVKPGNGFDAPHKKAVQIITEGLIEVGLLKGEVNQLIQEGKYKQFYMHRTSHWLGLDVHDVGVYQHGEVPQVLQPGQVLTIEPGLYVVPHTPPAEDQPPVDDRWVGIGIRIEDDVLVTPQGNEVLTAGVPKEISDLQRT
ncbi:aminopeptidase P N-terminal domain-containing protein [Cylindrospermopsis raciborskii]|uniref:Xaa-Pro aminopeptidase n=2 Tax=Cylindrospermopsis raciborskii TaxID=77022 RepID=A0A853MK58_9CYAN|nr:aminopeptidase P N-terminal domain-containing protein [Cylindrospermopsis raciborskii]EFA68981.1 Peptidase M24B, X-Pro dipeptidase/aminopeptidase-like protein [Cylindrospermopsis raciborskii CS-505]OBU77606.1 Xaa-Pro aminopeptidase [Cylindrospermopsis raciborskii CS-505]PNJ91871.1 Xaa-Pro aminopeptidase [Cylindrospermopsis raciborskii C07]PNJ93154.1 Xaa-Pro aminopeptidase [Cylindrospermopsis raciborskii C03]PNJ93685.1 Xaa-Pro aminopeptidase [Cylindrospermopsis raciborskii C04]